MLRERATAAGLGIPKGEERRRGRSGLARQGGYIVAIACLLCSLTIVYGWSRDEPLLYVLVAAIFLVSMVPLWKLCIARQGGDIGEPAFWVGLLYFAHFGLRAIYLDHVPEDAYAAHWGLRPPYSSHTSVVALSYVLLGLLAMMTAYYSPAGRVLARSMPRFSITYLSPKPRWPILMIGAGGVVGEVLLFAMGYGTATTGKVDIPVYLNIVQSLASLLPSAATLYFASSLAFGERSRVISSILLLSLSMLPRLLAGWRGVLFSALWTVLLPVHYLRRRVSIARFAFVGFLCLTITVAVLIPVLTEYRAGILTRPESFWSQLVSSLTSFQFNLQSSLQFLFNRMVGLDSLMLVIEGGERLWGKTLAYVFIGLVPRILWPSKPNLDVGRMFAVRFLGQPVNAQNSMSVMNIGELFWNFDLSGVVVGMALIGLLYRVVYEYLLRRPGVGNVFLYTVLFPKLTGIESAIGMLFAGIVSSFLIGIFVLVTVRLLASLDLRANALAGAKANSMRKAS